MKYLISLIAILFTSTSLAAGGISSGGGGTIPGKSLHAGDVVDVIMEAKRDVRLVTNFMSYLYRPNSPHNRPYEDKIFGGQETLTDLVEKIDIDIESDKPCYDANGIAVDGSIHSDRPNAICISAFTTAPKLIKERARKEIIALVIHELGHLLSLDEEEATDLQGEVLIHLDDTFDKSGKEYVQASIESVTEVIVKTDRLQMVIDTLTYEQIRQALKEITGIYLDLQMAGYNLNYSLVDRKNWNYFEIESQRLHHLFVFAASQTSNKDALYWQERYEKIFGINKSVKWAEIYEQKFGKPYDEYFGEFEFEKMESKIDMKKQLQAMLKYFSELSNYLYSMQHNVALHYLPNPDKDRNPNPFQTFLGKFSVTNSECFENGQATKDSPVIGYDFFRDQDGKIKLKTLWNNAWSIDGLYNNAGDTLAGSAVTVDGTLSSARKLVEHGNPWGQRWDKKVFEIYRDQNGVHILWSWDSQSRDSWDGSLKVHQNECHFEGTFTEN